MSKIYLHFSCLFHYTDFVDKTEDDIKKHNQWYAKYVELKEKKKVAIKNWKESRLDS